MPYNQPALALPAIKQTMQKDSISSIETGLVSKQEKKFRFLVSGACLSFMTSSK